jgi:hypothetical protein
MGKDINQTKLVGGKRKNGHKYDCSCHICENMKNKAMRGGYEEEVEKEKEKMMDGPKKKNGHRRDCNCPICKNMKNSKKIGASKSTRRTKKRINEYEKEDYTEDEKSETLKPDEIIEGEDKKIARDNSVKMGGKKKNKANGHKSECKCPICKNMCKKKGGALDEEVNNNVTNNSQPETAVETNASENDYDALDAAEKGEAGLNVVGGTRRKRGRKKYGGKKWGGKTRKTRKYN